MRFTLPLSVATALSALAFAAPAYATTGCNAEGWGPDWFSDVRGCHSSYPAIRYMKDFGIVEGYADGTFKPEQPINRAEFTKILMGVLDGDGRMCKMAPFPDAPMTEWYGQAVHKARCHGVIDGYPDGTFRPGNLINYAEAAKIAANAYGLKIDENAGADWGSQDTWFLPYSFALLGRHAVPPTVDRYAHPLTRGEMAEMIYRLETGKTSFDWFQELADGDGVTVYGAPGILDGVEFSYPGSLFAKEESAEAIPDVYADDGSHMIRTIQIAYVRTDESEQGCDGMSGMIESCRPSKSDLVINVGIVDRAVEHLALGMSWRDTDEVTSVAGRPARSFREGIECEGRKFVLVPLDATRSLAITRTYNCNDTVSFARQEELFSAFLETIYFQSPYVAQAARTMDVTVLMCDSNVPYGSPEASAPTVRTQWTVPHSTMVADMTLRALFEAYGNENVGSRDCPGVSSLRGSYRGVTVAGGVATVKLSRTFNEIFGEDDEEYSVSAQRSISANLKQFPSVKDVRYVVQP